MKQEFSDIRAPRTTRAEILDLITFLEVDASQVGNGITVTVGLCNQGETSISLLNPFDMVQFHVANSAGFPVNLPTKAPNLLINSKALGEWRLNSPLPIVGFYRNGEVMDDAGLDVQVMAVEPKEEVQVSFMLDQQLAANSTTNTPQALVTTPLPAGDYTVQCILTLINAVDTQESRVLESPTVRVSFMNSGEK